MKTTLKILAFIFIVTVSMTSCSSSGGGLHTGGIDEFYPGDPDYPFYPYDPETLKKLRENITPTKPIKIPDTMRIVAADPSLYITQQDTVSQDSIPESEQIIPSED